jgi:RNA-directed DNA polymerase
MALDPVAETTADSNSFGFRKERSTADAIQQCFIDLAKDMSPQWILEGDIKGCFDNISHEWLLNNIPMDKVMLRKWLKCGFVFNKELFPTEEGTPQGGIISPTLANMTLDGLQTILAEKYHRRTINKETYYPKVNLVRYADDFIITGRSKELLEEIMPLVREFLQVRGLTLSEEKTRITHIDEGFDFLGFNVRKYKGKLLIKPSDKGLKKFMEKVKGIIDANKTSKHESLIRFLNPVITGWANYYKSSVASETFRKADSLIFHKLWRWSVRRHPKKGKYWIANKYFRKIRNRNWCFSVEFDNMMGKKDTMTLKRVYDTKIKRHIKIKGGANPYDPEWKPYFEKRETNKMLDNLEGRKSLLYMWEKQKRICPVCSERIDRELAWSVTEETVNSSTVRTLVHDRCRRRSVQIKKEVR